MKKHDDFEHMLAQQLRGATPYLDDDGFTEGVLAQLESAPKRKRVRSPLALFFYVLTGVFACFFIMELPFLQIIHEAMAAGYALDLRTILTGTAVYVGAVCLGVLIWVGKIFEVL